MTRDRKRGGGPDVGPTAAPSGAPPGPRRPSPAASSLRAPGRGGNRPASLVSKSKQSTQDLPDLRLRYDDIGRGFLYVPILGDSFAVPEPCTGKRTTERLTPRAVRQLKGAAIKAHNLGRPLRTFITFTVRGPERQGFLDGDVVLGTEIKRTFNAFNESRRRRGLDSLVYIWAAENKDNVNPHVHLMTDYRVPRGEFDAFAAHLESLWGHGFAKIEKLRNPQRAGGYLMKAVGYTAKGAKQDQGTVIGNRYGISREIMPRYDNIDLYQCEDAATTLKAMQGNMTEEIEQIAPDLWLTPHGLSLSAGTDIERVGAVIDELARGPST